MFTANPTSSSGFSFGAPVNTSTATSAGFSFGSVTPGTGATSGSTTGGFGGFNLGASTTSSAAPTGAGFNLGASTTSSAAPTGAGFNFGASTTSSAAPAGTGFNFGSAAAKPPVDASGGFGFTLGSQPQPQTTQPKIGGFSFGQVSTSGADSSGGLGLPASSTAAGGLTGFGGPALPASSTAAGGLTGFGGPALPASSTAAGGLTGFGGPALPASSTAAGGLTGFGFKTPASTAPSATGFAGFGVPTSTSSGGTSGGSLLGGLLGTTTTTSTAPPANTSLASSAGFNFATLSSANPTSTAPSSIVPPGFGFSSTTAQSNISAPAIGTVSSLGAFGTSSAPVAVSSSSLQSTAAVASGLGSVQSQKQMTFRQLEETINKWTTELEEQEKCFLEQATQVNGWDRIVMENGEKIIQLNKDVERVKLDQQKLDHELDFIQSQQNELEDLLTPLEKNLDNMPPISYQQHADVEREHTYMLAESLDAQLKRMGQDLKEIIERLNSTNSKPDTNDPVQQITKILNAHVVSLMWIDRNSANLQRRVEEISKQMDIERREHEKNFRLAYS